MAIIYVLVTFTLLVRCVSTELQRWELDGVNNLTMLCPDSCLGEQAIRRLEKCCACESVSEHLNNATIESLVLEYYSVLGDAHVVRRTGQGSPSSDFYDLEDNEGFLRSMPGNICDFPKISSIRLPKHQIEVLDNLSCLKMLVTLDLNGNEVSHIGNTTFNGLESLRYVNFSRNNIQTIDPGSLYGESFHIVNADFSKNEIFEIDVTNMIIPKKFCFIDFSSNVIEKVVDRQHFHLEEITTYGPGHVAMDNNRLEELIDFQDYGLDDMKDIPKFVKIDFKMDGSYKCDCKLEPYLESLSDFVYIYNDDIQNTTCSSPQELKGMSIKHIIQNSLLDFMICHVANMCPDMCVCYDQPSIDRVVVNCTGVGLTEMPDTVPNGKIHLILAENKISEVQQRDYFDRIVSLDLTSNDVHKISDAAAGGLINVTSIDFIGNSNLGTIPKDFKYLGAHVLELGDLTITCECTDIWIRDYRKYRSRGNESKLECRNLGISIDDITEEILGCNEDITGVVLASVCTGSMLVLIILTLVAFWFRYEILILTRGLCRKKKLEALYNIYISVCEEDDFQRKWISQILLKILEERGYRVILPCRDILPGEVREDACIRLITNSSVYLIVLSEEYMNPQNTSTCSEYNAIWDQYMKCGDKRIVLINYDELKPSEVKVKSLRALVRVGECVGIANRHNIFFRNLIDIIGETKTDFNAILGDPNAVFRVPPAITEDNNKQTEDHIDCVYLV